MTSISLAARTAMVCAGRPNSQRKRLGSANQTWPVEVRGWASDLKARVWMQSADQVWMLVWALSQEATSEFVPAAGAGVSGQRNTSRAKPKSNKRFISKDYLTGDKCHVF